MANDHGLRTKGVHTGNFGRPKVKAGESLDISPTTLKKDGLIIPRRDEAFARLQEAYEKTDDPKLKQALWEMLRARKAAQRTPEVKPSVVKSPHWDHVKRVR